MSAPIVYAASDPSSPILNGTPNEFVDLLDKCLRVGYPGKAPAGWLKTFVGTNKATFKPTVANQFTLRVLDHQLTSGIRWASLRGYETVTDVDTGSQPFPTPAQLGSGIQLNYNVGSVARPWVVIADDRTVYVFTDPNGNGTYYGFWFGDFYSYVPVDSFRTGIAGMITTANDLFGRELVHVGQLSEGHYIARAFNGLGESLQVGKHSDFSWYLGSGDTTLRGTIPYPDPISGGIVLAPLYLHEQAQPTIRGKLRGLWYWCHPTAGIADRAVFSGAAGTEYAGRTFMIIGPSIHGGLYVVETSNTWLTN